MLRALHVHVAAGRLSPHEYDARVEAALAAPTRSALLALVVDLPDLAAGRPRLAHAVAALVCP